eukprot:gene21210-22018_t
MSRAVASTLGSDEEYAGKIRASFISSYRTYGARRVWHDLLAEGLSCGLHRVERLMRLQGLMARPRRRGLPKDDGVLSVIAGNVLDRHEQFQRLMADNGVTCSMSRSGNTERIARKTYRTRNQARQDEHSTLGHISPMDFEKQADVA